MEEEGLRPTAAQTFRAGHDPAIVTPKYGSWFGFLRVIELLGEREAAVADAYGDMLRGVQTESITKCYKLIAIRALLHDGELRTGGDVEKNAETSRQLMLADPRLARDVPAREFPTSPLRRQTSGCITGGSGPSRTYPELVMRRARTEALFRLADDRIEPTFVIDNELGRCLRRDGGRDHRISFGELRSEQGQVDDAVVVVPTDFLRRSPSDSARPTSAPRPTRGHAVFRGRGDRVRSIVHQGCSRDGVLAGILPAMPCLVCSAAGSDRRRATRARHIACRSNRSKGLC